MLSLSSPPSPPLNTLRIRRPPSACATASPETSPPPCLSLSPTTTPYDILGIPISASPEEVKTAYRKLARSCHPDVIGGERAEFMKVHAAYSTLSDPQKRAEYDRRLFRRVRPPVVLSSSMLEGLSRGKSKTTSFGVYKPRRNWESDQCW